MDRSARAAVLALLVGGAVPIGALSAVAEVDRAKSTVTATGKQLGVPMDVTFSKFNAAVNYDPANLAASTAKVEIDVTSVDVGSREYSEELKKKDWFDTATYPTATFVSSAFKPGAGGKVDVVGKLTIKGVTQEVTAPVSVKQDGASQVLEGALAIKRNSFRVGDGAWKDTSVVADDVTIRFHVVTAQK